MHSKCHSDRCTDERRCIRPVQAVDHERETQPRDRGQVPGETQDALLELFPAQRCTQVCSQKRNQNVPLAQIRMGYSQESCGTCASDKPRVHRQFLNGLPVFSVCAMRSWVFFSPHSDLKPS